MNPKQKNGPPREPAGPVRLAAVVEASDERTIEVVACTAGVNQKRARVDIASWRLDRYLANPVVLYGHADASSILANTRPADTLPIGKASNVRIEDDTLRASITFAPADVNPFAEQVYRAFAGGYLNAVSVGFLPGAVAFEVVDGEEIAVLSNCELYEISVVPLPADAGAVAVRNASSLVAFAAGFRSPMTMTEEKPVEQAAPVETEKPAEETQAAPVPCPECGYECDASFAFCPMCGESMKEPAAEGAPAEQAAPAEPVQQSLRGLTGAGSRIEALGIVQAWKLAAEGATALRGRIAQLEGAKIADERRALIERLSAERKLTPAMRPWAESCELAGLKAFAAVAAPVVPSAVTPRELAPTKGGRWEDLSNMQRHELHSRDPEAFAALLADYRARTAR